MKLKSTSTSIVYSGVDLKRNIYYTQWDEVTRPFLHWGQFAWSPQDGEELWPISLASLHSKANDYADPEYDYNDEGPDSTAFINMGMQDNPSTWSFFSLLPTRGENSEACRSYIKESLTSFPLKDRWAFMGSHIGVYHQGLIAPGVFGEREGLPSSTPIVLNPFGAYGAINESESFSMNAQYSVYKSPFGLSANAYSKSTFYSATTSTFMDLNGDQFPDKIKTGDAVKVQITNPSGGHTAEDVFSPEKYLQKSLDASLGITRNAYYLNEKPKWVHKMKKTGGSLSFGSKWGAESLVDINGDGLPDKIEDKVISNHSVQLNNGAGFESVYTPVLPNSMANNGLQGASKEETIAYAIGGFVGGVTLGVGTAAIAGAGGAAVLSTSGSLMANGAVAIVSSGLSNASTQVTAMALGAQDEFDSQELMLTLAISIPEAIAFGALSKALKGGLTKHQTARSMARQTHREKNIFMKQTIKKLREINRGRFSNRQMREAAEKIYEMSLNSEQEFFKFQVYIHDGFIKIATTTVGNITTNEIIKFNKNEE